jgi:hypothetical protein
MNCCDFLYAYFDMPALKLASLIPMVNLYGVLFAI